MVAELVCRLEEVSLIILNQPNKYRHHSEFIHSVFKEIGLGHENLAFLYTDRNPCAIMTPFAKFYPVGFYGHEICKGISTIVLLYCFWNEFTRKDEELTIAHEIFHYKDFIEGNWEYPKWLDWDYRRAREDAAEEFAEFIIGEMYA